MHTRTDKQTHTGREKVPVLKQVTVGLVVIYVYWNLFNVLSNDSNLVDVMKKYVSGFSFNGCYAYLVHFITNSLLKFHQIIDLHFHLISLCDT